VIVFTIFEATLGAVPADRRLFMSKHAVVLFSASIFSIEKYANFLISFLFTFPIDFLCLLLVVKVTSMYLAIWSVHAWLHFIVYKVTVFIFASTFLVVEMAYFGSCSLVVEVIISLLFSLLLLIASLVASFDQAWIFLVKI
jgi:hypothetical protein